MRKKAVVTEGKYYNKVQFLSDRKFTRHQSDKF